MQRITLTQYLVEQQHAGTVPGDLRFLLEVMAATAQGIAANVAKGALTGVLGEAGSDNVQGEAQKKLDVIANDMMLAANEWGGALAAMASEEIDVVHQIPAHHPRGRYLLMFDPLDGSSNIGINVSVGTIFSVLELPGGEKPGAEIAEAAFLQPGRRQVAAGYALYGPSTLLVLTVGEGVQGFTLDREAGCFVLTHANMQIPRETREFAINASNVRHWEAPVQRYVAELQAGAAGSRGVDFNMRWVASMVADVHRVLSRGGIFMYPIDEKCRAKGGKLRLLYEANPMALLVEQAGGLASTGRESILDLQPTGLHQRVPVILGSADEVERVVSYHHNGD